MNLKFLLSNLVPITLIGILIPLQFFIEKGIPVHTFSLVVLVALIVGVLCSLSLVWFFVFKNSTGFHMVFSIIFFVYVDIFIVKNKLNTITGNIELDTILFSAVFLAFVLIMWRICNKYYEKLIIPTLAFFLIILTIGFFLFTPKNHNFIHVGKTKENFASNQMPPIIHIIFDELSSPKYLPAELSGGINYSTMVSKLLEAHNYTLFPEAFSRSSSSIISISSMINFDQNIEGTYEQSFGELMNIRKSAYLRKMSELGYRLYIFENSSIHYCNAQGVNYALCDTTDIAQKEWIFKNDVSESARTYFLFVKLLQKSTFWLINKRIYMKIQKDFFQNLPHLPETISIDYTPFSALKMLKKIKKRLDLIGPGDFMFAHLLLPHSPYILDKKCNFVPDVDRLVLRLKTDEMKKGTTILRGNQFYKNYVFEREKMIFRYYVDQFGCAISAIYDLIGLIEKNQKLKDALVILHGDHGNRKFRTEESNLKVFFAIRNGSILVPSKNAHSLNRIFFEAINGITELDPKFHYRDSEVIENPGNGILGLREVNFSSK